MAGKDDTPDDDLELDSDIGLDTPEADDDSELRAILLKELEKADDEDTEVFSGPEKTSRARKTVSVDDGLDLIDKADRKGATKDGADEDDDDPDPLNPKPADKPAAKAEEDPDAAKDDKPAAEDPVVPPKADLDALLDGIDGEKRTQIAARIQAGDEILDLFRGQEDHLKSLGIKPKDAVANLLKIEQYARANPHEYIAWAAGEIAPGKAGELLGKAAAIHGFKLVPVTAEDEGEDDPFEDEEKKALRKENRELKAAQQQPPTANLGPDNPTLQAQRSIEAFMTAKDEKGALLHPFFQELGKDIASKAKAHKEATGQNVTPADLKRFYDELEPPYLAAKGLPPRNATPPQNTPAAQQKPAVADKTKDAANLERSKAASKSIDGTGQGAGRRPPLSDEADLRSVVTAQVEKYMS